MITKTNKTERKKKLTRRKSREDWGVEGVFECEDDSGGGVRGGEARGGEAGGGGAAGGGGEEGEKQELRQKPRARGPRRARKREAGAGMAKELTAASFSVLYNYIKAR